MGGPNLSPGRNKNVGPAEQPASSIYPSNFSLTMARNVYPEKNVTVQQIIKIIPQNIQSASNLLVPVPWRSISYLITHNDFFSSINLSRCFMNPHRFWTSTTSCCKEFHSLITHWGKSHLLLFVLDLQFLVSSDVL